jgi:hypothetical protein
MNYEKIYYQIINKAISECRTKQSNTYYELHHIVPKCLGGTNEKSNLVLLTAREHYICHMLLVEVYPNNKKILYAADDMHVIKSGRNYKVSSRLYNSIKEKLRLVKSESMKINNPMKSDKLRKKRREEMIQHNLMYRLTNEQREKHRISVSKSKLGGKNPNAKSCIHIPTGIIFDSGADLIRQLNLKSSTSITRLVNQGIVAWV